MEFYRKGSFLERQIGGIFKRAGFKTELNSKRYGFESDVIATHRSFKVIIECKEYNTYLNIPALLHQWESKKRTSGVERVILVVVGIKTIPEKMYKLAKSLDVILWDDTKVNHLSSIETKEQLREKLNRILKFDLGEFKMRENQIQTKKLITAAIILSAVVILYLFLMSGFFNIETKAIVFFLAFVVFIVWILIDPKRAKMVEGFAKGLQKASRDMGKDYRKMNKKMSKHMRDLT